MAIDIGSMGLIVILENLSPFLPVYVRLFKVSMGSSTLGRGSRFCSRQRALYVILR